MTVLLQEINRCQRYNLKFSVTIIDIDFFKSVNDTYGHPVGDTFLIELSNIIKGQIRESDILGRWGGEEFLILSPETDQQGMLNLAENMREAIETFSFTTVGNKTASFGVSTYIEGDDEKTIVNKADKALYSAKNAGRNRVHFI